MRLPAFLLILSCLPSLAYSAASDPLEIVRRSCQREAGSLQLRQSYTYQQTQELKLLDGKGNVKETRLRTEEVLWIDGERYQRLVRKNGKPLSASEEAEEQKKLDNALSKRRRESEGDRRKRLAKQARNLQEERELRLQIPDAFTFTLVGEEAVRGRPCWRIQAEPKPGFRPRGDEAKMLPKIRGTLWVDQKDYEWARIEAETVDTIGVGFGLFRIGKGARLGLEQGLVNGEFWTPMQFRVSGNARAFFVKGWNVEVQGKLHDFRKYSVDSVVTTAAVE